MLYMPLFILLCFVQLLARGPVFAQPAGGWTYHQTTDAAGHVVQKASVRSPTQLDMGYPYGRGAVATLTLRSNEGGTTVYVELSKGHFNRSFQNGTARVRFDGQPARQYALLAAANGRANIVFLESDRTFITSLKRANQMMLDVSFAGQVGRQMVFPTAGLRWPR